METYYRMIGDGLSMGALAIIFALSYGAAKRVKPTARVPLYIDRRGAPGRRVSKNLGLWGPPVVTMLLIFLPTLTGATHTMVGQEALMLLCLRAIVAAALAMRHLTWLKGALDVLDAEGELTS